MNSKINFIQNKWLNLLTMKREIFVASEMMTNQFIVTGAEIKLPHIR